MLEQTFLFTGFIVLESAALLLIVVFCYYIFRQLLNLILDMRRVNEYFNWLRRQKTEERDRRLFKQTQRRDRVVDAETQVQQ